MSFIQFTVEPAVGKVNDQPNKKPDDQSPPGIAVQRGHHGQAHHDAHNRERWKTWASIRPGHLGMGIA